MAWVWLGLAILAEVIATSALKATDSFSRLGPSVVVLLGYGLAFYFLSLVLQVLPVGIAYAVWSGVGIVLVSLVGWLWYGQTLSPTALAGIGLILAGTIVLNLSTGPGSHG
ncbi:DMT family transporter [Magnetospirillum molischianum]|uniref:Quaternary ammonium compound-resistance protein qacE n=1 Tax=Magnetospirillum molischianum DSM 120 TaxID=1150626 RepID=H8FMW5_MAGML|nr:multidrug efflux SMR transporter [Magnetospirillum molischianum]CCG39703.1 Quaternary ammonium compound-resistance protein qacE [Magnetospirillum molischianum DSM 120]